MAPGFGLPESVKMEDEIFDFLMMDGNVLAAVMTALKVPNKKVNIFRGLDVIVKGKIKSDSDEMKIIFSGSEVKRLEMDSLEQDHIVEDFKSTYGIYD